MKKTKKIKKGKEPHFKLVKGSIDRKSLVILLGIGLVALLAVFFLTSQTSGLNLATTLAPQKQLVKSFSIKPQAIDTSDADAKLTFTVEFNSKTWVCIPTDPGCEREKGTSYLRLKNRGNSSTVDFVDWKRTSGDGYKGTYSATAIIKRWANTSPWEVEYLTLIDKKHRTTTFTYDQLANDQGVSKNVMIIANKAKVTDSAAPTLQAINILPTTVNTTAGDQEISVVIKATDDLTGVCIADDNTCGSVVTELQLTESTTGQAVKVANFERVSGSAGEEEKLKATVVLPKGAATGVWKINYFTLMDKNGSFRWYRYDDLTKLEISPKVLEFTNVSTSVVR